MSWELKLDAGMHDLVIENGAFVQVNGSNEVLQRVQVALWHHFEEYFLNIPTGVPWYNTILGRTNNLAVVGQILRRNILRVDGVIRIVDFSVRFDSVERAYNATSTIQVQPGPGEPTVQLPLTFNINAMGEVN